MKSDPEVTLDFQAVFTKRDCVPPRWRLDTIDSVLFNPREPKGRTMLDRQGK